MAATEAILGFGTQWQLGDGAPSESFTNIAEPHNINGVGTTFAIHDATHQQSPDFHKEYIAGLKDDDEFSVDCGYIPADATHDAVTGLWAVHNNRQRANMKIIWPFSPAVTLTFAALVTKVTVDAPLENLLMLKASIKPTGIMTLS